MKLKHEQSLSPPVSLIESTQDGITDNNNNAQQQIVLSRVQCLCIAPNLIKMAACYSQTNHIVLFDLGTNEEKDKFALKSGAKSGMKIKLFFEKYYFDKIKYI